MPKLINRNLQIPGGMGFYLPELKWTAPRGRSFDVISRELQRVIQGNPQLAKKHGWPTDLAGIEAWVDLYNATVCQKMGWDKYIAEEGGGFSVPKSGGSRNLEGLKAVAGAIKQLLSGARTLGEWVQSGDPPVARTLANTRAQVCVACPLNQPGDWTQWFTIPAAELIKRYTERAHERNLTTLFDDKLGICSACHCPMHLKVHVPLQWIKERLTPEESAELAKGNKCWILNE